jgi:hypothetical protein
MSIKLTPQESKAVELAGSTPASVTDPRTYKTYVLASMEVFKRHCFEKSAGASLCWIQ